MSENIEKQEYLKCITNAIVELNGYLVDLNELDKLVNGDIRLICYYISKGYKPERVEVVENIKTKFEKYALRIEILKSKLRQHQNRLNDYFKTYNDFKDSFYERRNELARKISGFETSISNQIVKCDCYLQNSLGI